MSFFIVRAKPDHLSELELQHRGLHQLGRVLRRLQGSGQTQGICTDTAHDLSCSGSTFFHQFSLWRWRGGRIFETGDIQTGWNSTVNGEPVPYGVYVYTITYAYGPGESKKLTGTFTLVREASHQPCGIRKFNNQVDNLVVNSHCRKVILIIF
jgi:hypothetical protein